MALTMTSVAAGPAQDDIMDIDIDMDVDEMGPAGDDGTFEV